MAVAMGLPRFKLNLLIYPECAHMRSLTAVGTKELTNTLAYSFIWMYYTI